MAFCCLLDAKDVDDVQRLKHAPLLALLLAVVAAQEYVLLAVAMWAWLALKASRALTKWLRSLYRVACLFQLQMFEAILVLRQQQLQLERVIVATLES